VKKILFFIALGLLSVFSANAQDKAYLRMIRHAALKEFRAAHRDNSL
jgi:hypothetical protein